MHENYFGWTPNHTLVCLVLFVSEKSTSSASDALLISVLNLHKERDLLGLKMLCGPHLIVEMSLAAGKALAILLGFVGASY